MRDITVAVIGGVATLIVGLVVASFTRTQQVWVYVGSLVVCGLVLGALQLWSLIKRRRDAFKADVIATAKDQILSELGSRASESHSNGDKDTIPSMTQPGSAVDEVARLFVLLEEGRVLQGGLRASDSSNTVFYGDEAAEIGRWEGRARAALARLRDRQHLGDFQNAPGFDGIGLSRGAAYRRMDVQLNALEWALRAHQASDRDVTVPK